MNSSNIHEIINGVKRNQKGENYTLLAFPSKMQKSILSVSLPCS